MFDVGFFEVVLLFVIGLLILGPEKLPRVATQVGRWIGRARRTATQLRHQIEREVALNDIRKPPPQRPPPSSSDASAGETEDATDTADGATAEPAAEPTTVPDAKVEPSATSDDPASAGKPSSDAS